MIISPRSMRATELVAILSLAAISACVSPIRVRISLSCFPFTVHNVYLKVCHVVKLK